jgi:S1-C subfamily serine protease
MTRQAQPPRPLLWTALRAVLLAALAALLVGCGSAATQLLVNPKLSDAVKSRSFKSYHEVLFVPPRDDPRGMGPRVASAIEAMGFKVTRLDPNRPIEPAQGTGFVVDKAGWLLTCAHVVGAQKEATVTLADTRLMADVIQADAKADLALLKLRDPLPAGAGVLGFRAAGQPGVMGEDVFTIGYPLSRMLGNSVRMSRGLLSATAGLRDNAGELQVSAEIHPGNSGGPLLDRQGQVIGVVNKTINPAAVAQATGGALPQNINFAIKAVPVLDFIKAHAPAVHAGLAFGGAPGLESAGKAVAKIQAGNAPPDQQRADKLLVRLGYSGQQDISFRIRTFALAAFDYETQEPLFVAGQLRDAGSVSEEALLRDTLEQFRKAISAR